MNNIILKTFLVATLFAGAGINTAATAQTTLNSPSLSDVSVIPEGLITFPPITTDVIIVLDNSGSMRQDTVNGTQIIGAGHGNSRSYQAREAIRNVLPSLQGSVNIGLVEFNIDWSQAGGDGGTYAVNTCGDATPRLTPFDNTGHFPSPVIPNCATPTGTAVDADGNTVNTYNLDQFGRIIADNQRAAVHTAFNGSGPTGNTPRARVRVGVQELTPDHLERLNNVLAPEFLMPELRCNATTNTTFTLEGNGPFFAQSQTQLIDGQRVCGDNEITNERRSDYLPDAFVDELEPTTIADEASRIVNPSFFRNFPGFDFGEPDYGFSQLLLADTNNNGIPDAAETATAPSLSSGTTPSFPALIATHNYLRGIPTQFTSLLQEGDSLATPVNSSTENIFQSSVSECTVSTIILFITDGLPTATIGGTGSVTNDPDETCSNPILANLEGEYECVPVAANNTAADVSDDTERRTVAHVRNSIAPLLTALRLGYNVNINAGNGDLTVSSTNFSPIETFVVGFGDLDNEFDREILDLMANSGSLESSTDDDGNTTMNPRDAILATTGGQLQEALLTVFDEITADVSTNGGFSISSAPISGGGAVVSPSFVPTVTLDVDPSEETDFQTVYWNGDVTSFFLDEFGFFREDSNDNGILEGYGTDFAFITTFDPISQSTTAQRLTINNAQNIGTLAFDSETDIVAGAPFSPTELDPIWSASDVLNDYPQTVEGVNGNLYGDFQRPYEDVANTTVGYRSIFTALPSADPADLGALVIEDFVDDIVTNNNFGLFAVDSVQDAQDIVRFIRGEEGIPLLDADGQPALSEENEVIDKFRNRTLGDQQFLLGDIVHSSPVVVGAPEEDFGISDASYAEFQSEYLFRRRMVYIGGNDGLLHAFNGGFFQAGSGSTGTAFRTQASLIDCTNNCDNTPHPLGAEIWAYAPYNLLPHLQFIAGTDYRSNVHVSFVDGPVQSFDVQAFDDDETHINGWGTIIVASMRLGGSEFVVDLNGEQNGGDIVTTRSAYIVLDVTDPTQPPVLLAEITEEDIGFTTSLATVQREGDNWFLAFGSGPNNIVDFTSDTNADGSVRTPKFYRYQLNEDNRGLVTKEVVNTDNGFVGELLSQDWDSDLTDDAVYFGVIGGDVDNPSGGLYRYVSDPNATANQNLVVPLFVANQAIGSIPATATSNGENWLLFGGGRLFADEDFVSAGPNSFFGIIEPRGDYGDQTLNEIVDVTNVGVTEAGVLTGADLQVDGVPVTTEQQLSDAIVSNEGVAGWRINLQLTQPSERVTANPVIIGDQVVFASFIPGEPIEDQCVPILGQSFFNIAGISTGLPSAEIASFGVVEDGNGALNRSVEVSTSAITELAAVTSANTDGPGSQDGVVGPDQNGGLNPQNVRNSVPRSGRTSWTELEVQ